MIGYFLCIGFSLQFLISKILWLASILKTITNFRKLYYIAKYVPNSLPLTILTHLSKARFASFEMTPPTSK